MTPGRTQVAPPPASQPKLKPVAALFWFSLLAGIISTLLRARFAIDQSWFIDQDFEHLVLLQENTLPDYLMLPIDIHMPTPLHRAACWIVYRLLGMDFSAAVAFLCAVHLATGMLLFSLLRAFCGRDASALLTFLYLSNAYILDLFMWWSAGLHRFPYLLAVVAASWHCIAHQRNGGATHLACSLFWLLFGLGFFEKSVLIPLYQGGALALYCAIHGQRPRKRLTATIALGLFGAMIYGVWVVISRGGALGIGDDTLATILPALLYQAKASLQALLPTAFDPDRSGLLLGAAMLAACASVLADRRAIVVWILVAGLLCANFLIMANPSRISMFGPSYVLLARYQFELVFVQILGLACLLGIHRPLTSTLTQSARSWRALLAVCCVIGLYAISAFRSSVAMAESQYAEVGGRQSAQFVRNFAVELDRFAPGTPPVIEDRTAPRCLYFPFMNETLLLSQVFRYWSHQAIFATNSVQADFRLLDDGRLVPVR